MILPILCFTVLAAGFAFAPGNLEAKAHFAMHGLCAQRPSHSLQLGGSVLPFDARMTGLYLGAAATFMWVATAGRLKSRRLPRMRILGLLIVLVIVLAADGLNALLVDLGLQYAYEPQNTLRLATGVLAGISLGVGLAYLFAVTIWAQGNPTQATVSEPWELVPPLAIASLLAALAHSGLPVLFAPLAIALIVAAIGVFWTLTTVLLALILNRSWSFRTYGELAPLASAALLLACLAIAAMAGLRLFAESLLHLPQLT